MDEILESLNQVPGVLGSLLGTSDGMVVAARLKGELNHEAAAALVSSLLVGTTALLDECGRPHMEQIVLRASRGKIIIIDLGHTYLMVVTDRNLDLNQGLVEVRSAAQSLRKLTCIPT